ncbi:cation:proton antiporter [Nocardia sp. NPDC004568]|uniref:cation:proton antiporter n=1 Tax=Nocardia sp. NPDC004568 TaxID=3154551 RepID=UPI0033B8BEE4
MIFLLTDLVLIIVAARLLGGLARRLGQPAVIGEIAAGILVGPTVLGAGLSEAIFPAEVKPQLTALAEIGVVIFMFLAGLEIDRDRLAGHGRSILAIAVSAFATPFVLGCALAFGPLARHHDGRIASPLFLGCALAVTAFPVLARILQDRGLFTTRLGQLGLAGAAVVDIFAWCALSLVFASARPEFDDHWRLLLIVPLVAVLWWVVRPVLARTLSAERAETATVLVGVCGAMATAAVTEWMGLHVIFGAFLFGVIFPRTQRPRVEPGAQLVSSLFLPAFFVVAGLRVDLSGVDRAAVVEAVVIVAAAVAGKMGGTYLAARLRRLDRRTAGALAALMNTRGLTELVILNVGLTLGVIDTRLYSVLVLMALITTAMTGPLLTVFGVRRPPVPELGGERPATPPSEGQTTPAAPA